MCVCVGVFSLGAISPFSAQTLGDRAKAMSLLERTYGFLCKLQAPVRDVPNEAAWQQHREALTSGSDEAAWVSAVCDTLSFLLDCIGEVQRDKLEAETNAAVPVLAMHGLPFMRARWTELVQQNLVSQGSVATWRDQLRSVLQGTGTTS